MLVVNKLNSRSKAPLLLGRGENASDQKHSFLFTNIGILIWKYDPLPKTVELGKKNTPPTYKQKLMGEMTPHNNVQFKIANMGKESEAKARGRASVAAAGRVAAAGGGAVAPAGPPAAAAATDQRRGGEWNRKETESVRSADKTMN